MRRKLILGILVAVMLLATIATAGTVTASPETIVVTPADMKGWIWTSDGKPPGSGGFVLGPGAPPSGIGSANMKVQDSTQAYALMKVGFWGLRLDQIVTLEYSTYQSESSAGLDIWTVSLQFVIDYNCTDGIASYQGRLVFEPVYSPYLGTPMKGVWQTWSAKDGKWWATKITPTYGFSGYKTISEILTMYPDACIHSTFGAVLLKVGSGWANGFDGNVDELVINENTYDFEPPPIKTVDLIAGQNIDVGDVIVWLEAGNLYVKYVTVDGWAMTETHLAVAASWSGIPQKNGNPIPGRFPYSTIHDPPATEYTYTIPYTGPVSIAAHAEVIKLIGTAASWQYATQVIAYKQGKLVGGGPITDPARTDPIRALGAPDGAFYSLGFVSVGDGYIVLGFGYPIYNGPNPDVRTVEITWGNRMSYPREAAKVYAIVGSMEYYLGTVTNHDDPNGISYVSFDAVPPGVYIDAIKLVDDTYKLDFPVASHPTADGYDLDAVGVRYLVQAEETAWGDGTDFPGANWATYFTYPIDP